MTTPDQPAGHVDPGWDAQGVLSVIAMLGQTVNSLRVEIARQAREIERLKALAANPDRPNGATPPAPPSVDDVTDGLDALPLTDLRAKAMDADIEGFGSLDRDALVERLREATSPA